jgi:hypothetical protein
MDLVELDRVVYGQPYKARVIIEVHFFRPWKDHWLERSERSERSDQLLYSGQILLYLVYSI